MSKKQRGVAENLSGAGEDGGARREVDARAHLFVRGLDRVYSIQYGVYSIQYRVYSMQYRVYSTQYTGHSKQYTMYRIYIYIYIYICVCVCVYIHRYVNT